MLANEIISLLSTENSSLIGVLLKANVFLHEIGKKELAEWVTHELNGYPDGAELPPYRILESRVMGNLMAPGWTASGQRLPIQHLEPAYREQLEKSELRESLALVQELAGKPQGSIRRHFPPEANAQLGSNLGNGWAVQEAWCEISTLAVQNVLIQVRTRLLEFMLELKDSAQNVGDGELNKANTSSIDTKAMFNNAIFGPNATIIIGDKNIQNISSETIENNLDYLKQSLASIGIPQDELSSLQTALEADRAAGRKPSFEGETGNWFSRLVGRAAKGGLSIGVDVVSSVAAKALTGYFGS